MPEKRPVWPEAEIVAEPISKASEPRVLVRRRQSGLVSADADLVYFNGPPVISLFTGCGGMDLGLEAAGLETVVQHEWSEAACLTLMGNRPRCFRNSALIQGDLRKTPTAMILKEAGLEVGEAHLVCGGPPCQGFTTANAKAVKGIYDPRNDLVFEFLRVVTEAKPKMFMFENVKGFVQFNKGDYPKRFLRAAYDAYYELVYGLIDCVEYGVPQHRCRFICMGTRKDLVANNGMLASLPKPQCFGKKDIKRMKIIGSKPEFAEELRLITHAPGIRYFPDREFICNPDPTGHDETRSKVFVEFFRRIHAEEPDRVVFKPQSN